MGNPHCIGRSPRILVFCFVIIVALEDLSQPWVLDSPLGIWLFPVEPGCPAASASPRTPLCLVPSHFRNTLLIRSAHFALTALVPLLQPALSFPTHPQCSMQSQRWAWPAGAHRTELAHRSRRVQQEWRGKGTVRTSDKGEQCLPNLPYFENHLGLVKNVLPAWH